MSQSMMEWALERSGLHPSVTRLVRRDGDCWRWTGRATREGYGRRSLPWDRGPGYVHRQFYEAWVGPVPAGHHLHHRCGQKLCVNPAHLEVLTITEHGHLHSGRGGTGLCGRCGEPWSGRTPCGKHYCNPCNRAHRVRRRREDPEWWQQVLATERARHARKKALR